MRPPMGWVGNLAALAVAGSGAGYAATHQPLWRTGGSGSSTEGTPLISDVVPSRAQQLARIHDSSPDKPFDVLIIGGGATGAGCALDAATRGLRTAMVEREDWASGTSSKSTKLVHGGVRYLEKAVKQLDVAQLKLVYEALHERRTLLDNAPHLSKPLAIITPCYKWWEVPYYWAGMKMYDLLAGSTGLIMSKFMGTTEMLNSVPTLAPQLHGSSLKGGIVYYDGQFDDARLNVTLACSAAAAGAAALNYMECSSLIKNQSGQVVGAKCRDTLTGEQVDVYARVVINATGPFLDAVRRLSNNTAEVSVTTSSGAHITLPGYLGSNSMGIIIPKTADGRVVFLLPFQGHLIAGTTDNKCELTTVPHTTASELAFILSTLSDYLGVRVSPSDVLSTWSGIRPLASNPKAKKEGGSTENIVRDHVIFMDDDGLLNVTGGKWTTYRRMAEDTLDAAIASGRLPLNTRACATEGLKLLGARAYRRTLHAELAQQYCGPSSSSSAQGSPVSSNRWLSSTTHAAPSSSSSSAAAAAALSSSQAGQQLPVSLDTATHLVDAYGDRAPAVLALAAETGLGQRLVEGHPYLEAEVLYCTQSEYCMTVQDFIARRSRLAFLDVQACQAALPRIAAIMGKALSWSSSQQQAQIAAATTFLQTCFTAGATVSSSAPHPAAVAAEFGAAPQQQHASSTPQVAQVEAPSTSNSSSGSGDGSKSSSSGSSRTGAPKSDAPPAA